MAMGIGSNDYGRRFPFLKKIHQMLDLLRYFRERDEGDLLEELAAGEEVDTEFFRGIIFEKLRERLFKVPSSCVADVGANLWLVAI